MAHLTSWAEFSTGAETLLAIGTFDGVHRGHQEVIRALVARARAVGLRSVAVTFHPHPAVILGKRPHNSNLTHPQARARLLEELGVDVVITQPFDQQLSLWSAHQFIAQLQNNLRFRELWCGYDFALGYQREGNLQWLAEHAQEYGYELHISPAQYWQDTLISSSSIRNFLRQGAVERAAELLTRPYRLSGKVVRGEQLGRKLGFPTANLDYWQEQMLPANGVYACQAWVNGQAFAAAVNIGVRPTVNQAQRLSVEAHLLEFSGDLYGQTLQLDFLHFLRGEQRFASLAELQAQIARDLAQVTLQLA